MKNCSNLTKKVVLILVILVSVTTGAFANESDQLYTPQVQTRDSVFKERIGLYYGFEFSLNYNAAVAEKENSDALLFHQLQTDQALTLGYSFNGWASLYFTSGFKTDLASTNNGVITMNNRFNIYWKLGPRFYITKMIFVQCDFVTGLSYDMTNWNYYLTLGADARLGIEVYRSKMFNMSLQPIFEYKRGSYTNEFAIGCLFAIEA